jgi:ankyrin repeat protein
MPDAVIDAIRARDLARLRALVKDKPRGNAITECGREAWLAGFKFLQSRGADLNTIFRGYRPLHSLLQEDAHKTAAEPAPERLQCLDWLLANGADPEQLGAWPPARAIIIAAFVGSEKFVKRLRNGGAVIDDFAAAALGDRKRVEKVLAKTPSFARDRDANGMTALQYAAGSRMAHNACCKIARLLVEAGADITARVKSWKHEVDALYFAGSSRNAGIFELLLERGADPHEALTTAVWNGDDRLRDIAMSHGAAPDKARADGQPLLNNLIRWGQLKPAMWLLERGASPNLPDEKGWTAVHQAASRGNERMIKAVLEHGGDVRMKDREGNTPAEVARKGSSLAG